MKQIVWIVEKDLFDEYESKLVDAINKSGAKCVLYDTELLNRQRLPDLKTDLLKRMTIDDITIFHGSLQLGRRILRETSLYPAVYLTLPNYECFSYYGYYGDRLLNSKYVMMGINDVLRNKEAIFNHFFGSIDKVFIRPSNGFKSFTGQCLPYSNFEFEFNLLVKSYGGVDMNTLVVLAPAQEIEEEYRFVVVDNKIVSGSLYMDSLNRKEFKAYYNKPCLDKDAFIFANTLTGLYEPDSCYNMDICRLSNGEYKLLEINSFCCGSLYGNDCDIIVKAVNELIINDYNDMKGL